MISYTDHLNQIIVRKWWQKRKIWPSRSRSPLIEEYPPGAASASCASVVRLVASILVRASTEHLAYAMVEENVADKSKRRELWGFFFLTVIFAPALAVAIVGGYGFLVWMYQLVQGPPTY